MAGQERWNGHNDPPALDRQLIGEHLHAGAALLNAPNRRRKLQRVPELPSHANSKLGRSAVDQMSLGYRGVDVIFKASAAAGETSALASSVECRRYMDDGLCAAAKARSEEERRSLLQLGQTWHEAINLETSADLVKQSVTVSGAHPASPGTAAGRRAAEQTSALSGGTLASRTRCAERAGIRWREADKRRGLLSIRTAPFGRR